MNKMSSFSFNKYQALLTRTLNFTLPKIHYIQYLVWFNLRVNFNV